MLDLISRLSTFGQALSALTAPVGARRKLVRTLLVFFLVAIGYYIGTIIGFALTPQGTAISAWWPPNAILLAAFLSVPRRMWWILVLAVLPAHLVVQLRSGVPIATALGWFVSNTAEGLLGAFCIHHFNKSKRLFASVQGTVVFLVFGFLLAPLITSFLDAGVVVATGWSADYWTLWTRRLFTNMLAELTLVPPIVMFASTGISEIRKASLARYAEASFLILGIVLASVVIFGGEDSSQDQIPALIYAPLPLLLWAAVRFGPGGLSASLLIVSLVSISEALQRHGPFRSMSMNDNLLYLQIFLCMVTVPMLLLAAVLTERRASEQWLRSGRTRLIEAQEQERHRIARELHDDVGQQLALAELRLAQLKADSSVAAKQGLERLSDQLAEISQVTREISHGLYPTVLQHLGLAPALKRLSQDNCRDKSVSLDLASEQLSNLPADVSLALYRVAQEALHNIDKHSHSRNVAIELKVDSGRLVLRIADDGVGFDPNQEPATGLGLASMRERLRSVGGTIQLKSAPKRGTRIEASVPLSEASSLELPLTG